MNTGHDSSTFEAALDRNHAEINNALLKLTAHDMLLEQEITYVRMSFFVVVANALYNDLIAHSIKVLDEHRDATSFWYILKCNEAAVVSAAAKAGLDLEELKTLSGKLRHIREKTHFHIDKKSVKDPKSVWVDAGIRGIDLTNALRGLASTLSMTKAALFGGASLQVTEYDGSDIEKIVRAYESVHGEVHGA